MSRYVVFQYLPDPITDERVNFGVAAAGSEGFHARFLNDWRRVGSFSGKDAREMRFLREFADTVVRYGDAQGALWVEDTINVAVLFDEAPNAWINTIQVTEPRASTKPSDQLADDVAKRFLRAGRRKRRGRDRRWVRAVAHEAVINALDELGVDDADDHVAKVAIEGRVEAHEFDVALTNGEPVTAALALSFERQNRYDLQRDYASAAWAIEDVRNRKADLPLAVLMLPPVKGTSKTYEQALYVFKELDAQPVPDAEIDDWAADAARALVAKEAAG